MAPPLDLSLVREWSRDRYAERGRPSIDPVVSFKLQLVMLFEGIRSERQLIETASLNLAHRWYLGYALDEDLPDHSNLTRIRQRLGIGIFERFFLVPQGFPTPAARAAFAGAWPAVLDARARLVCAPRP